MNPKEELEKRRIVCGPMTVAIDGVCRRKLQDKFNNLLDRLTIEIHPEGADPDLEEFESAEGKEVEKEETLQQKRKRLIEEGKMHVDVKKAIKEYEEKVFGKPKGEEDLMGNSKMLQNPSGKIEERNSEKKEEAEGKTKSLKQIKK